MYTMYVSSAGSQTAHRPARRNTNVKHRAGARDYDGDVRWSLFVFYKVPASHAACCYKLGPANLLNKV